MNPLNRIRYLYRYLTFVKHYKALLCSLDVMANRKSATTTRLSQRDRDGIPLYWAYPSAQKENFDNSLYWADPEKSC